MGQLKVVVGGQAGSEAKGACTAYLAREAAAAGRDVTVIRVAGPNAGHTAYDDEGRKWALRQVPVGAVANLKANLYIGPGSEIDIEVLDHEVNSLEEAGIPVRKRLYIDQQATILTSAHRELETEGGIVGKLGSTGKGVGAARSDRIWRKAEIVADQSTLLERYGILADTSSEAYLALQREDETVIIEGTQGYVLGLHAGYYPQCTSSDCRAIDFLAMAGIDPNWVKREDYEVWVVMRTYPIRVAGNSGPLHGETSWEDLELEIERTTVTQKIRRVGAWNTEWARAAVVANGGPAVVHVALSMVDYVVRDAAGATDLSGLTEAVIDDLQKAVYAVEQSCEATVDLLGTGPRTFIDLRTIRSAELTHA